MAEISVLLPQIANLIAAGEVVERPASVIKELIENSVDAGAKTVSVEIRDGGITYMRVTDDGKGMSAEDAQTAFLRHATSKIHEEYDLTCIKTLGFRGEALAAIASVAHVELFTKRRGAQFGTHVVLEAGEIIEVEETGCPDGTTIVIKDLFFNTPARMKFLKKDSTEASYIETAIEHLAIGHSEIKFQLVRDGKQTIGTIGDGELRSAVYSIYGPNLEKSLLSLSGTQTDIEIAGFTTGTEFSRSNRGMQNFFVNGRYVQSRLLAAVMDQAYSGRLMHGKFPACFIKIRISPSLVDVNVHPTKLEVKFAHEKEVFSAVYQFVSAVLDGEITSRRQQTGAMFTAEETHKPLKVAQITPIATYQTTFKVPKYETPKLETKEEQEEKFSNLSVFLSGYKTKPRPLVVQPEMPAKHGIIIEADENDDDIVSKESAPYATKFVKKPEDAKEQPKCQPQPQKTEFRLVGEIFATYILLECEGEFLMIDKHAGHERILYNKLKNTSDGMDIQALLAPENIIVTRNEKEALLENISEIRQAGFEIEDFGGNSILVRGAPMYVKVDSFTDIITDIAEKLMEMRGAKTDSYDAILKSVACKAAVKAGYFTDEQEMKEFVSAVLDDPSVRNCPHGRPVIVRLTKQDIEKMFKRIV